MMRYLRLLRLYAANSLQLDLEYRPISPSMSSRR